MTTNDNTVAHQLARALITELRSNLDAARGSDDLDGQLTKAGDAVEFQVRQLLRLALHAPQHGVEAFLGCFKGGDIRVRPLVDHLFEAHPPSYRDSWYQLDPKQLWQRLDDHNRRRAMCYAIAQRSPLGSA